MKILSKLVFSKRDTTREYQLTEADWDTLVRATAHEGKPYYGVIWALIQRFCWIYPIYKTLSSFVEAYAQPINPKWFPDGSKHKAFIKRNTAYPARIRSENKRAARRLLYSQQPIEELDTYAKMVNAVLSGEKTSPVRGAVHYSASFAQRGATRTETAFNAAVRHATKRRIGPVVRSGVGYGRGVNWFFAAGGSHRPNTMQITILQESESSCAI